jgi:hypothetical protein
MRKVKNNISVGNPALMFAQGVESLISDPMHHPAQGDYQESDRLKRLANKPDSRGNLFSSLMRQFANY